MLQLLASISKVQGSEIKGQALHRRLWVQDTNRQVPVLFWGCMLCTLHSSVTSTLQSKAFVALCKYVPCKYVLCQYVSCAVATHSAPAVLCTGSSSAMHNQEIWHTGSNAWQLDTNCKCCESVYAPTNSKSSVCQKYLNGLKTRRRCTKGWVKPPPTHPHPPITTGKRCTGRYPS